MQIELTKEELECLTMDTKHILTNIDLPIRDIELRKSLLQKLTPQPTREELTKKWIKDNNIVIGSKVKVVRRFVLDNFYWADSMDSFIGEVFDVKEVCNDRVRLGDEINDSWLFLIESLEPYKEEWIHFTFEDRELFRSKWIRLIGDVNEHMINFIGIDNTVSCANWKQREGLISLFETHEFIDGTPFGKLK